MSGAARCPPPLATAAARPPSSPSNAREQAPAPFSDGAPSLSLAGLKCEIGSALAAQRASLPPTPASAAVPWMTYSLLA